MSRGSYLFVAAVFSVLAASFLASTFSIITEFWDIGLAPILTSNSYLFVFFPTLGLVALTAFYIPAVIFTDIYFHHAKLGPLRFILGTLGAIGLSIFFSYHLNQTQLRSVWEVSPAALEQNLRAPRVCTPSGQPCASPILEVMGDLRENSLARIRVSPFIRNCAPDKLLEVPPERDAQRWCFPAQEKLNADRCCEAKQLFAEQVHALWANPHTRSNAATYDLYLLPFKSFFIIIIVLIGVLLIGWKKTLRQHYSNHLRAMERGLLIGAVAMLFWPIMDYAYQQTSDLLYGPAGSFPLRLSLVVVPWALLLTFYFADKVRIELARLVQIIGSIVSGVAILRYQDISDWSSKLVGLGAAEWNFYILLALSLIVVFMLWRWLATNEHEAERDHADYRTRGDPDPGPMT